MKKARKKIKINNYYQLEIITEGPMLQLTLLKNEESFICRKDRINNLKKFLLTGTGQRYAGRLQLSFINTNQLSIIAKKETIGSISSSQLLEKLP